jgi:hypothetical protein
MQLIQKYDVALNLGNHRVIREDAVVAASIASFIVSEVHAGGGYELGMRETMTLGHPVYRS